jgi:hypothetical protein
MSYDERKSGIPEHPALAAVTASILIGAASGLAIGVLAFAGPVGVIFGGAVGATAGAIVSELTRRFARRRDARDAVLDREIGVSGGDIGAPRDLAGHVR